MEAETSSSLENNDFIESKTEELVNEVITNDQNEGSMEGEGVVEEEEHVSRDSTLKLDIVIDEPTTEPAVDTPSTTQPLLLVPSLKGKMTYEAGTVICKGVWAMSEYAHSQPGACSEFEFRLVKPDEGSSSTFPINGKYQGWFYLKQPPPMKGNQKIEDKEILIEFSSVIDIPITEDEMPNPSSSISHRIKGKGMNKFGSFNLHGTLDEEGNIQIYREYYNLTPAPTPHSASKRKGSFSFNKPEGASIVATTSLDSSITPREGSGRIRKSTSIMKEYEDVTKGSSSSSAFQFPVASKHASKQASKQAATSAPAPSIDRPNRLNAAMKKCLDLLRELEKNPQGIWFLEPVDYIKLNIPDYPLIIPNPMDFKTIRQDVDNGKIDCLEVFGENVRLVFRNAIVFNNSKDNPVHMAAIDLSRRFEDKFRQLSVQLGASIAQVLVPPAPVPISKKSKVFSKPIPVPIVQAPIPKQTKPLPGPRAYPAASTNASYLPPPVDIGNMKVSEMQKKMKAMEEELATLRAKVREYEITLKLQEKQDAAHNPLSYNEKQNLIAKINQLPEDKMEAVINIIQSSMPAGCSENGEEMEVPLDMLDTGTLRKLQKFVEENTVVEKKKRGPAAGSNREPGQKKARKSNSLGSPSPSLDSNQNLPSLDEVDNTFIEYSTSIDVVGLNEDSTDLLFSTDSFDDLQANELPNEDGEEGEGNSSML